jgi:hypothetical protein
VKHEIKYGIHFLKYVGNLFHLTIYTPGTEYMFLPFVPAYILKVDSKKLCWEFGRIISYWVPAKNTLNASKSIEFIRNSSGIFDNKKHIKISKTPDYLIVLLIA